MSFSAGARGQQPLLIDRPSEPNQSDTEDEESEVLSPLKKRLRKLERIRWCNAHLITTTLKIDLIFCLCDFVMFSLLIAHWLYFSIGAIVTLISTFWVAISYCLIRPGTRRTVDDRKRTMEHYQTFRWVRLGIMILEVLFLVTYFLFQYFSLVNVIPSNKMQQMIDLGKIVGGIEIFMTILYSLHCCRTVSQCRDATAYAAPNQPEV